MIKAFEVDVLGNKKLDDLISRTQFQHGLWLLQDNFPSEPQEMPKDLTGFIPVSTYLPVMNTTVESDSYMSEFYLLLTRNSRNEYSVEDGFLMKWKDDKTLFWYNHDQINGVVGFMPLPKIKMKSAYKTKKIGTWG